MAVTQVALTEGRYGEKDCSSSLPVKNLHNSVRSHFRPREETLLGALQLSTGTLSLCYTLPGSKTRLWNNPAPVSKHSWGPTLAQGPTAPEPLEEHRDTTPHPCPALPSVLVPVRHRDPFLAYQWCSGARHLLLNYDKTANSISGSPAQPRSQAGVCPRWGRDRAAWMKSLYFLRSMSGTEGRREGDLQANTELMRTTSKLPK